MMSAEHRRPLAAFLLVFAFACMILVNGTRTQVADVLAGPGAPPELTSPELTAPETTAPETTAAVPAGLVVSGQSLRDAPQAHVLPPPAHTQGPSSGFVSSGAEVSDVASGRNEDPGSSTVAHPATRPEQVTTRSRPRSTGSKADQAAPDDAAVDEGAPVPTPEPAPVAGSRASLTSMSTLLANLGPLLFVPPAPDDADPYLGPELGHDEDSGHGDPDRDPADSDHEPSRPEPTER